MAQVKSSRSFVGDPRGLGYHVRSGRKGADVITISDLVTEISFIFCHVSESLPSQTGPQARRPKIPWHYKESLPPDSSTTSKIRTGGSSNAGTRYTHWQYTWHSGDSELTSLSICS